MPPPPITAGDGTTGRAAVGSQNAEEDGEGEDELLPAMADDDYSAQLSWQSQSKDNLKYAVTLKSPCSYRLNGIT